jgi:hypothetical protein
VGEIRAVRITNSFSRNKTGRGKTIHRFTAGSICGVYLYSPCSGLIDFKPGVVTVHDRPSLIACGCLLTDTVLTRLRRESRVARRIAIPLLYHARQQKKSLLTLFQSFFFTSCQKTTVKRLLQVFAALFQAKFNREFINQCSGFCSV